MSSMSFMGRACLLAGAFVVAHGCGSVEPQPRRITVQIVGDGGGRVTSKMGGLDCPGVCAIDVADGSTLTLEATAETGSEFVGFDVAACGFEESCTFEVTRDRTVTARFEVRRARVTVTRVGDGRGTVTSSPPGLDCGETCSTEFPLGTNVTLTAMPEASARFGAWSAPCADRTGECVFEITTDVEIRATFDDRFATLGVVFAGSGTGEVRADVGGLVCTSTSTDCEATYEVGTRVTLTAIPGPATSFVGWSGSEVCSGRQPCTLPVQRSQTVTATFEAITHALSITRSGPGRGAVTSADASIDCGQTCAGDFDAGTTVALRATAEPYYRFVRWTDGCAGTSPTCTVTMDTARSVDAEFEFTPQLTAGFRHACATSNDGRLRCWGANDFGQLGYGHTFDVGATASRTAMTEGDVPVDLPVESIALGFDHTCVLLVGGRVRCWGRADEGQLGYGDVQSRGGDGASLPESLGDVDLGESATSIFAGELHSCARTESGRVFCWGSNTYGQIGYGSLTNVGHEPGSVPRTAGPVLVGALVRAVVASSQSTCVHTESDALRCWGRAHRGQLGYGNTDPVGIGTHNTPASAGDVPTLLPVQELYPSNGTHTCARLADDGVRCWGWGLNGRTGYGNENNIGDAKGSTPGTAGPVSIGAPVVMLSAGGAHTCLVTDGGALRCWGYGLNGQLGYGNPDQLADTPATVPSNNGDVPTGGVIERVATGGFFTCGRYRNGTIKCWGDCTRGVCGYGDETQRGHTPTTVPANLPAAPIF